MSVDRSLRYLYFTDIPMNLIQVREYMDIEVVMSGICMDRRKNIYILQIYP